MREILFKAKRKDNGEWIEGGYAEHDGKSFIVIWKRYIPDTRDLDEAEYYENHPQYNSVLIEVIPETVCEYIGLTDENGNKIFENDIVGMYSVCREEYDYGVVGYGEFNCSCCDGVYGWTFGDEDIRDYEMYEVKGNIFDNPELLENSINKQ